MRRLMATLTLTATLTTPAPANGGADRTLEQLLERRNQRAALEWIADTTSRPDWKAWIAAVGRPANPPAPCPTWSGGCLQGGRLAVRPCAIPAYICAREAGAGDRIYIDITNPTSSASGKYQFINGTWAGYGGYSRAGYAPETVQDAKAAQLWAGGRGCAHWAACR